MSLLSDLFKKVIPPAVVDSPIVAIGLAALTPYISLAATSGKAAVVRAVSIPLADLEKIAPKADVAKLTVLRDAQASATADLVLALAGVI